MAIGMTLVIGVSWFLVLYFSGMPYQAVLLLVGAGPLLLMFGYMVLPHVKSRLDSYLSPENADLYQVSKGEEALLSGGLWGKGIGEGVVKDTVPDAHTDFVFAVAAEEYGLILVLCIILLYSGVVVRSLLRLVRERDPFIRLAGTGLACMFGVQAMINMGVAVRLLPAKGMTLPFVSYGGSSVIASGIAVGMLLAFTRTRPQGEISDILGRGRAR